MADNDGWVRATDNPEKSNAEIAAALAGVAREDTPVIAPPADDLVELPGGLVKKGEVIRTAVVRELTGVHEEALAKALASTAQNGNWAHFLAVLLECGTERIGDAPTKSTTELLKDLLIGDRDALVLGIRKATYGDEVSLTGWACPNCGGKSDITLSLAEDIDTPTLGDPRTDSVFEVQLRKGGTAAVRLANGRDQAAVFEKDGLTVPERDSILLSRCLRAITQPNGMEVVTAGLGASIALGLSIPDRRKILKELSDRQPGPRYNDVKFTHQACGEEVPLSLSLGDLFPDLL